MANLLERLKKRFTRGGEPLPQPANFPALFAEAPKEEEWQKRIRLMNERIEARKQELRISGGGRTETHLQ